MSDAFNPEDHCPFPHRGFEQLLQAEKFILPSRTVTDAHFSAFQMLSGDNHPIHYDRVYCENQGHRDLLAHGLQVLCFTAAGAGAFPHIVGESLIGFIELTVKFKGGVYVNDTLYPSLQITELKPQKTTGVVVMRATVHNQAGELVLDGQHTYLLRLSS